jgi:F0F1-type ATP synthase epsilon subunit
MADKQEQLNVKVITSSKLFYDGPAYAVSSINKIGPFDILPEHENFITLLKDKVVIHGLDGKDTEIPCQNGLLEVSENRVRVFLGI